MKNKEPSGSRAALTTYLIVAGSAIAFSSKGVFVKLAYAHEADTITVLVLRMGFSLPVFLVAAWASGRRAQHRLTLSQWGTVAVLGFFGYYLSSLVNFMGLNHVSLGLERIVLYTYPSLVLLGTVLFKKRRVRKAVVAAMALAYSGIVLAYWGEAGAGGDGRTGLGVALVFGSALSYAVFVTVSGDFVHTLGAIRFTSLTVASSCIYMIIHYFLLHRPEDLIGLPAPVYFQGLLLAGIGTVLPTFLMGIGLRRAGAQKFAIIGTVGPLGTVILAWILLGERLNGFQSTGFLLSVGGGLAVTLLKEQGTPPQAKPEQ